MEDWGLLIFLFAVFESSFNCEFVCWFDFFFFFLQHAKPKIVSFHNRKGQWNFPWSEKNTQGEACRCVEMLSKQKREAGVHSCDFCGRDFKRAFLWARLLRCLNKKRTEIPPIIILLSSKASSWFKDQLQASLKATCCVLFSTSVAAFSLLTQSVCGPLVRVHTGLGADPGRTQPLGNARLYSDKDACWRGPRKKQAGPQLTQVEHHGSRVSVED